MKQYEFSVIFPIFENLKRFFVSVEKSGHIPGAININIKKLAFDVTNNKLYSVEQIKKGRKSTLER